MKYWKTKFVIYITHRFDDLKSVDVQGKSGVLLLMKIWAGFARSPLYKKYFKPGKLIFKFQIVKMDLIA